MVIFNSLIQNEVSKLTIDNKSFVPFLKLCISTGLFRVPGPREGAWVGGMQKAPAAHNYELFGILK